MTNEEYTPEVELDENDSTEEQEDTEQGQEQEEDSTDWKAEALKYKAILDRNKNKKPSEKSSSKKTGEFDYGQKAFLVANDIKSPDEMKLVKDIMESTGKSLDEVIESKYFKAELNEIRELKRTQDATPKSGNRSNNSAQDSVEYWLAKGELPPKENVDLRRQVVNARMKKQENTVKFYNS